jgi:hypothetical protein
MSLAKSLEIYFKVDWVFLLSCTIVFQKNVLAWSPKFILVLPN